MPANYLLSAASIFPIARANARTALRRVRLKVPSEIYSRIIISRLEISSI